MAKKVVVIGAGPAGLISLTNFQRLFTPEELEIVCYERRDQLGGEWINMKDHVESYDKFGFPMRTSVYEELQMNTPTLLIPPYPDHKFPEGTQLYPSVAEMYNYLKTLADKHNLEKYIIFDKMVSDVSFNKETSKFSMKIHDLKSDDVKDETCDYVLMCDGRFGSPRKPHIDMSKFTGEWFHYHDLRDPKRMFGKRVLVVGSSWGGLDMVNLLNRPGRAKSVHVSYRSGRPLFEPGAKLASVHAWPTSAEGNTVTFKDGTSVEVDAVIFANGFTTFFPLVDDLKIDFEQNAFSRFLPPLYKSFVHPRCPKLFLIGMPHVGGLYVPHPQSILIAKVIKGEYILPSEQKMKEDVEKFRKHWEVELVRNITEEDISSNFPLCELELTIADCYHKMSPDVPRTGGDILREAFYEFVSGVRNDCLNYKSYVNEFRADEKNPQILVPHFIPASKVK